MGYFVKIQKRYGCTQASKYPLWYADYDNVANFNDFEAFGGWKSPAIKQYKGTHTICNAGVDSDWYPDNAQLARHD